MNRTLFFNGPILTMESPMPTDALLVEDGRVVESAPSDAFFADPKQERTRAFLSRIANR